MALIVTQEDFKGMRIVSDGTITGTKFYSPNGEEVAWLRRQVSSVAWKHKAGDIPRLTVEFKSPVLEVTVVDSNFGVEFISSVPPGRKE